MEYYTTSGSNVDSNSTGDNRLFSKNWRSWWLESLTANEHSSQCALHPWSPPPLFRGVPSVFVSGPVLEPLINTHEHSSQRPLHPWSPSPSFSRTPISVHQCSSVFISVHQCSSVFISVHQCSSVFISVHQCSSVFISVHQCSSAVRFLNH
jgi:hypothetical protein